MPLDLLKLPANEAERLAYAEGFTMTAQLFARLVDLEAECQELTEQVEKLQDGLRAVIYAHDKEHELDKIIPELERLAE